MALSQTEQKATKYDLITFCFIVSSWACIQVDNNYISLPGEIFEDITESGIIIVEGFYEQ